MEKSLLSVYQRKKIKLILPLEQMVRQTLLTMAAINIGLMPWSFAEGKKELTANKTMRSTDLESKSMLSIWKMRVECTSQLNSQDSCRTSCHCDQVSPRQQCWTSISQQESDLAGFLLKWGSEESAYDWSPFQKIQQSPIKIWSRRQFCQATILSSTWKSLIHIITRLLLDLKVYFSTHTALTCFLTSNFPILSITNIL